MEKEIINALKVLMRTCETIQDCRLCPLRSKNNAFVCGLSPNIIPSEWQIESGETPRCLILNDN